MRFEIHTISHFDKRVKKLVKKYKSIKKDIAELSSELESNPYIGVDLGGGVRKIRMAISDKGKGKSGGARVITYTVEIDGQNGRVTLLTIYDKNEQDSISKDDIALLMDEVQL